MTDALFDLHGKVALVTGALGLLGRQHCECLAQAGAHVVALDLDGAACERFASELSARERVECLGLPADITRKAELERVKAQVLARFGRLDVLINNAALDDKVPASLLDEAHNPRSFEHFPEEVFRRSLEVNVTGTFLCCQVFGSHMAQHGGGSIVNVASTYALVGPDQRLYREPERAQRFFKSAAYPTSKGALLALTRFVATYWGSAQVRVNALCPGGVQTDQPEHFVRAYGERTPLARMAHADDYRGAVVFLASEASRYMTGATVVVDGGFTAW
jgi:NAD(P)-dependent dehydrogenase (short-subunit alcohol dehydrogenase family)